MTFTIFGVGVGSVLGAIVGILFGAFLYEAGAHRSAKWVTAILCASIPLLLMSGPTKVLTVHFAMIGFQVGRRFTRSIERELDEIGR